MLNSNTNLSVGLILALSLMAPSELIRLRSSAFGSSQAAPQLAQSGPAASEAPSSAARPVTVPSVPVKGMNLRVMPHPLMHADRYHSTIEPGDVGGAAKLPPSGPNPQVPGGPQAKPGPSGTWPNP